MDDVNVTLTLASAADSPRPLVLTPGQDLRGYVTAILGRTLLFFITFSSVLAVLLILGVYALQDKPEKPVPAKTAAREEVKPPEKPAEVKPPEETP